MNESEKRSWRGQIKVHPACELFPPMSSNELDVLADDIRRNGLINMVVLWSDSNGALYVLDGRNRLDAMEAAGLPVVDAEGNLLIAVRRLGVEVDPYEYVLSANVHRRHLTPAQKRELVAKVLKAKPGESNRTIARQTKTDDKTVAAVRSKLEATAEIPQLAKTVGADGKARTTAPTRRGRRTADDFIADQNAQATAVADRAEERSQQANRLDDHVQNAARTAELVELKQSDIERELPDTDCLVRKIIARDAIESGYALAVDCGIAAYLRDIPGFLKRIADPPASPTPT